MNKPFLTLTATAFLLTGSVGLAQAQTSSDDDTTQQGQQGQGMMQQGQQGERMTREDRKERRKYRKYRDRHSDMMRRHHGMGMRGHDMAQGMSHRGMMQVLFAIMDANGDGSLSLQEVQDTHARIFAHMDADDNDQVTKKEIKDFFHGGKDRRGSDRSDTSDDSDMPDASDLTDDSDDSDD